MELPELIHYYRGPLVGLLVSWRVPWTDAEDIAQDSFAVAYFKRDACRGDWTQKDVFGNWLRGIAHNQYRNWLRSRRRRNQVILFETPLVEQATGAVSAEDTEPIHRMRLAIERLPLKLRQVILMHYLEETSVNEVAVLLSLTSKTVEGRLYRARLSLRRMLDSEPTSKQIARVITCL